MKKRKIELILGYLGGGGLAVLVAAMLFPTINNHSYATCIDGTETTGCAVSYANTDINMTTKTAISLTVENQVNLELVPKASGAVAESSMRVGVSTNSSEGYALYLGAGNADGNLKPVTSNIEGEIANTTKTGATLDNLETNSYGYALSSTPANETTTYARVPVTGEIIKSTDTVTVGSGEYAYGDAYYLSFGTKIGTSLPAGTYAGSVVLSAVANPTTLRSLYDITYMQEMTPELCEATGEHYTKQLIDTRDGKSYWVAKLKDGNCWMVQNLGLDLAEDTILTSLDTDLPVGQSWGTKKDAVTTTDGSTACDSWLTIGNDGVVSPSTYFKTCFGDDGEAHYVAAVTETTTPASATSGMGDYKPTQTRSWNLGKAVLITPLERARCANSMERANSNVVLPRGSYVLTDTICAMMVTVDDTWQPSFVAQKGSVTRNEFVRKTLSNGNEIYVLRENADTEEADKDENGNYIPYEYTGYVAVDLETKTYDPHYLLGNYYQWNTATAGTGGTIVSTDMNTVAGRVEAEASICPKGWRLPKGSGESMTESERDDVWQLLTSYGWKSEDSLYSGAVAYGDKTVYDSPLYLFMSGFMDMGEGKFRQVGGLGGIWTNTAAQSVAQAAYDNFAWNEVILSSVSYRRYEGRSVRCVAR